MKCVISGSFRKFYDEIAKLAKQFEAYDIDVLSPPISKVKNIDGGFAFLDGGMDDPKAIEKLHLEAISKSDFLYIYNPGGYIGTSTTMEIGYALAMKKPVYALEKPSEPILERFIEVKDPATIAY